MTLKQDILNFVTDNGDTTFAELDTKVKGFSGEKNLYYDLDKNIWCWFNMSQEAVKAINDLVKEDKISLTYSTDYRYFMTGVLPRAPIARSIESYEIPHWLPIEISLSE